MAAAWAHPGYPLLGLPALGVGQKQTRSRGTTVACARLGARGGGVRALVPRGGGLTREARARARLQAAHARPLIGRLGRCGCARGARLEPWGRARPGVSGACAPRQQMRRIGRRVAGAVPCCLVTAGGRGSVGVCLPARLAPPLPAPRWNPEWALSRSGWRAGLPGPVLWGK